MNNRHANGGTNSNHNQHLGVNRIGKNIRKSPIHQSNFPTTSQPSNPNQHPQPQVYNISKNDFRNVVQQLTGTPSRDPSPNPPPIPRPANPPKPASVRLHKIRPPPLAPIARPSVPNPNPNPAFNHNPRPYPNPAFNHNPGFNPVLRPRPPPAQLPPAFPPTPPSLWANVAESPVSAYMRYLENSVLNPAQFPPQTQLSPYHQVGGLLPALPAQGAGQHPLPPSGLFPSPVMPSPSTFLNLLSPRSPYPLLSPRFEFPPPLTPTFLLSPLSQSGGILGPGPQPLPSPGLMFPPSPSWFLPSPRWRDM